MKNRNFKMVSAFMLLAVSVAWGLTRMTSIALSNSTIDSSVIGGTTPAAAHVTTLSSTGAANLAGIITGSIAGNYDSMNTFPSSVAGSTAGWTAYGHNGTGDMDFLAANNGSSPSFYWYYLIGTSVNTAMWLNGSAQLNVPNGIVANLTGLAATATALAATPVPCTSGGLASGVAANGNSVGCSNNIATATALQSAPAPCSGSGSWLHAISIAVSGNANCVVQPFGKSSSVTATATGAGSTANTSVPLNVTMPDTNYAASCNIVGASGAPYVQSISKGTTSITVTISNGQGSQAVASGGSEIDCTITGS